MLRISSGIIETYSVQCPNEYLLNERFVEDGVCSVIGRMMHLLSPWTKMELLIGEDIDATKPHLQDFLET